MKNFLRAHVELTDWINKNPAQAKQIMNQQLQKETGKPLAPEVLDDAFSRMAGDLRSDSLVAAEIHAAGV